VTALGYRHPVRPASVSLTTMPTTRRATLTAALAIACATGLAACSGDDSTGGTSAEQTPAQRLAAAKAVVDKAPSVHLTLTSADVPSGASGVVSADGWGKHPPAFKGTFKVSLKGVQADAEVVSLDGETYAKLPLVPGMNKIDPASLGLPDPATLFATDAGLTSLLTKTTNPAAGDQVRSGSDVLSTITGKVPGKDVTTLFGVGDANGTFDATYGLTDDQQLRQVVLKGPFFGAGSISTYTLVLDRYGEAITIEKP
jgi:lipoprotein LprG